MILWHGRVVAGASCQALRPEVLSFVLPPGCPRATQKAGVIPGFFVSPGRLLILGARPTQQNGIHFVAFVLYMLVTLPIP